MSALGCIRSSLTRGPPAFLNRRFASTLVIVEQTNSAVASSSLSAISAASKLGGPITALITGSSADKISASVASLPGVEKVLVANDSCYDHALPEVLAPLIADIVKSSVFSHVLSAHSAVGKNVLPRTAALLDVAQISDVIEILGEDQFVRPIYAGNAIATVKSLDKIKLLTIRPTSFPPVSATAGKTAEISIVSTKSITTTKWISEELNKSDRPELSSSKVVISGGRGLKNGENFKILYDLADKLGGAVGASRAAVDAGFVSNDLQIGQTGKVVAPKLYIAVGISGAIQHLAGMKDSKTIVAINKDPDAPIFQVADYGLVADLFTAVPELTQKIK